MKKAQSTSGVETALRAQRAAWTEVLARMRDLRRHGLPLTKPERVLLFGVGSSHFAAELAAETLRVDRSVTGFGPQVVAGHSLQIGHALQPRASDWVIAFTHRGRTAATIDALRRCREAGALTFAVVGQGAAELPGDAVRIETVPQEVVEPHTVSLTGAVCAVTALLGSADLADAWAGASRAADPELAALTKQVKKGPAVVVGEWAGEWIARESTLKLAEMAHLPVRAYSSEEYHHGPKVAAELRGGETVWWISQPQDGRATDLQQSTFKIEYSSAGALGWLEALVTAQWAALAVALNLEVNPDGKGSA